MKVKLAKARFNVKFKISEVDFFPVINFLVNLKIIRPTRFCLFRKIFSRRIAWANLRILETIPAKLKLSSI